MLPRTRAFRPFQTALAVAATVLAIPAAAHATTTVSMSDGVLTITGDDTASVIRAPYSSISQVEIQDTSGAAVVPGTGCSPEDASGSYVTCGPDSALRSIVANLGGGDDDYKDAITEDVPQTVDAGAGNDTVETGNGKDIINGGLGNDDLSGGRGDDTMDGGDGDDTVDGWDGNDTITGGAGRDKLLGDGATLYDGGSDTIYARDGEGDTVNCGAGADRATTDALTLDVVVGCEAVDATAAPGPTPTPVVTPVPGPGPVGPTPTPVGPTPNGTLTLAGSVTKKQSPKNLAAGKKLSVVLTANVACTGKVAIAVGKSEAKRLKLGSKAMTLGTSASTTFAAGAATTVTVGVDAKYRSKIKNTSSVKATVVIACATTSGLQYAAQTDVTLKK